MMISEKLWKAVVDFKNGNEEAFSSIYEESYKYLYTCVINIIRDQELTADMLQETYVEIVKKISQLQNEKDFLSWASTIANRKCFAYLKKKKDVLVYDSPSEQEENSYFENIQDDEAFIPENIFDNAEKIRLIRGIIDELTDIQRACVIGVYYNEQKQDDIAKELGIPVNTVKSHLNRAKSKIKDAVGRVEKEQGVKLYSIAPFMLLLLTKEAEEMAEGLVVPSASDVVLRLAKGQTATHVTKAATMTMKAKIVIAGSLATAAVAVTGGIYLHNSGKDNQPEPVVAQEEIVENDTDSEEIMEHDMDSGEIMDAGMESEEMPAEDETVTDDSEKGGESAEKQKLLLLDENTDISIFVDKYPDGIRIKDIQEVAATGTSLHTDKGTLMSVLYYYDGEFIAITDVATSESVFDYVGNSERAIPTSDTKSYEEILDIMAGVPYWRVLVCYECDYEDEPVYNIQFYANSDDDWSDLE